MHREFLFKTEVKTKVTLEFFLSDYSTRIGGALDICLGRTCEDETIWHQVRAEKSLKLYFATYSCLQVIIGTHAVMADGG